MQDMAWQYGGSDELFPGLTWANRPDMTESEFSEDLQRAWVATIMAIQDVLGAVNSQEALASRLRLDAQTVARYEKDQTSIPGPVDGLVRVMFALHVMPKKQRDAILERVKATLEDDPSESRPSVRSNFEHDPQDGWNERDIAH